MPKTQNAFGLRGLDENTFFKIEIDATFADDDLNRLQRRKRQCLDLRAKFDSFRRRIIRHNDRLQRYQALLVSDIAYATDEDYRRYIKPRSRRSVSLSEKYSRIACRCNKAIQKIDDITKVFDSKIRRYFLRIFANRLKEARQAAGLTQGQLAERLGTIRGNVCAYEQGRNEPPISTLALLARIFNCSTDFFLK